MGTRLEFSVVTQPSVFAGVPWLRGAASFSGRLPYRQEGYMSGTHAAREGPPDPTRSSQAPSPLEEIGQAQDVVRVLLVEDDPDHQVLVREMLREAASDAVITSCDRLSAGLGPITGGLADLVLLDLSLPDARGLDGLRRLRELAPDVPVVILTGNTDAQVGVDAVQAGAQDYLVKGTVNGESLAQAMRHAVERQRNERHLAELALRDPLTGLPNRVLFADRLNHALATTGRFRADELVVMFIDLDGFKAVNDEHGHAAGDELLVQAAQRLLGQLRTSDTVARLGGDEFVVLCEHVARKSALAAARRVSDALAEPYSLSTCEVTVSAAVGVAIALSHEDSGSLLKRADTAMYDAKRNGPGQTALAPPSTSNGHP
jgi:diguanylate cyclase (GGDEF)-like protein